MNAKHSMPGGTSASHGHRPAGRLRRAAWLADLLAIAGLVAVVAALSQALA